MPCDVLMKNALEPIRIEEGFNESMHALNNSAQQGKTFVVCTLDGDGSRMLLNMPNILTVREAEVDVNLSAI